VGRGVKNENTINGCTLALEGFAKRTQLLQRSINILWTTAARLVISTKKSPKMGPHRHFLRAVPPCAGTFLVLTAILCYLFENKRFQDAPIGDMIK
jgi:hypothetical protein